MKFTILGGTGFVGRNFAKYLLSKGYEVDVAPRDIKLLKDKELGHLIYILGLTGGDAHKRPHDTVEAHVSLLSWVLQNTKFESFLYCSSTRVYAHMPNDKAVSEPLPLTVVPNANNLFDLSKLLGESLCLTTNNPKVKIARLSNVYGEGQSKSTFLGAVIDELKQTGAVTIHDSPDSEKDYIAIDDVNELLANIAIKGQSQVYNVASGYNVKCGDIAKWIENAGYKVKISGQNPVRIFPPIDTSLVEKEFGFKPKKFEADIESLIRK